MLFFLENTNDLLIWGYFNWCFNNSWFSSHFYVTTEYDNISSICEKMTWKLTAETISLKLWSMMIRWLLFCFLIALRKGLKKTTQHKHIFMFFHYTVRSNKHCEILVSCSDKERNWIQAHETACKLLELHESSGNCMLAHVTPYMLM